MAQTVFENPRELLHAVGRQLGASQWLTIEQPRIDLFAEATGDDQWIHVDPERAANSPFGTTIAHGYFTLSMYPYLRGLVDESRPIFPGVRNVINYGINKLRFTAPVPVDSRIRARCELVSASDFKGAMQLVEKYKVEVEGQDRPACIAEVIMLLYF